MIGSLLLAVACQCTNTTPRFTVGPIAQTADAVWVQEKIGLPVTRIDKTSGEKTAVTPALPRTVSAIDLDGDSLLVATRTTMIGGGTWPVFDDPNANFLVRYSSDESEVLVDSVTDIVGVAHDTDFVYWTEGNCIWRRGRESHINECFAKIGRVTAGPIVDNDVIWAMNDRELVRVDKTTRAVIAMGVRPSASAPMVRTADGSLYIGSTRISMAGERSVVRAPFGPPPSDASASYSGVVADRAFWLYDEFDRYDPRVQGTTRYAADLCSAPSSRTAVDGHWRVDWSPYDPSNALAALAIDGCGVFVGAERKVCFTPSAVRIDSVDIVRGLVTPSRVLRSAGGDTVIINGSGFDAATTVEIDGNPAPVLASNDSMLSAAAPPVPLAPGNVSVVLRVRSGNGDCDATLITAGTSHERPSAH